MCIIITFSIVQLFADDTKISSKIKNEGDIELLQWDLDEIYNWADENCMGFNENKIVKMSHGNNDTRPGNYKTKSSKIMWGLLLRNFETWDPRTNDV